MISHLDHLVLTVADIPRTVRFYSEVLGLKVVPLGDGRDALSFGSQMIKLHEAGRELHPNAARATPGSADLCFLSDEPVEGLFQSLATHGVDVVEGPVVRAGRAGADSFRLFSRPGWQPHRGVKRPERIGAGR